MVTGWKLIDGTWYYFDGSGAMHRLAARRRLLVLLGRVGRDANGLEYLDGPTWYYLDPSGRITHRLAARRRLLVLLGRLGRDAHRDRLGRLGVVVLRRERALAGLPLRVAAHRRDVALARRGGPREGLEAPGRLMVPPRLGSGAMLTGWQFVNGAWYYMDASGAMRAAHP